MLYQKIRPNKLADVVGNRQIIDSLGKMIASKPHDRPHAFLFHGPSGCGKTTIARIVAKELGCEDMAIVEMNSANLRGLDSVREVANTAAISPLFGKAKCYIFDESHQFTNSAQQALLKVIEDCPAHVYFMFCTTNPSELLLTIRNRCAKYVVSSLRPSELRIMLSSIVEKEKIKVDNEVIESIAKSVSGCPREAIMLLEQVKDMNNAQEALEFLSNAETTKKEVLDLCRELISKRPNRWENVLKIYPKLETDPETVRLSLLGYFKKILLTSTKLEEAGRICELISIFEKPTYSSGEAALLCMIFESTLVE